MKEFKDIFELVDFKFEVKTVSTGVIAYFTPMPKKGKDNPFKEIMITSASFDELMGTDIPKLIQEFQGQSLRVLDVVSSVEASISSAEKTVKTTTKTKKKATSKPKLKEEPRKEEIPKPKVEPKPEPVKEVVKEVPKEEPKDDFGGFDFEF